MGTEIDHRAQDKSRFETSPFVADCHEAGKARIEGVLDLRMRFIGLAR
ncbi:hypothetical protein [Mesorhizobium sp. CN2-181]